jgi:FixJ family two-component response regulator
VVSIVDDDASVREALDGEFLLKRHGFDPRKFAA